MKKALSAVLAVVLVLGVCFSVPMIASANDANDFTYRLNEDGDGYIITGVKNVNNVTGEVTIPKEYTLKSGEGFDEDGNVITITNPTNALAEGEAGETGESGDQTEPVDPAIELGGFDGAFVVGETKDVTVRAIPNRLKDTNTMVLVAWEVKGSDGELVTDADIEVKYYETANNLNQWCVIPVGTKFGPPETGFPLMDITTDFKVTFKTADTYTATFKIVTFEGEEVLATATKEVVVNEPTKYNVTLNDVGEDVVLGVSDDFELKALAGEKVDVYVTSLNANYVVTGLSVTYGENSKVTDVTAIAKEDLPTDVVAGYTFTMPAADVSVSADYANKYNSVNIAEAVKDYVKVTTAADKEGKFEYNKSVTVKVTAPNGFELKTLTVDGQTVSVNAQNEYTFTITKDVAVTAEFQAKALPIVGIDEGAFAGCTGITSFKLAEGQTNFVVTDGVLFVGNTLLAFPSNYGTETEAEETYTIPETVTKIAKNAFEALGAIDYVFYNGNVETLTVAEGNTALSETVFHKGMTTHEKAENAEGTVTQNPNCTYAGVRTFYCKVCNVPVETAVEPIDATAHKGGAWYTVTAADCTDAGEEAQDCVLCNEVKVNTRPTEALGHTESDWIVTDATCTVAGEKHKDCTVCGEEIEGSSTSIDALGHKISDPDVVVKATCTEDGYVEGICDNCNTKQRIDEAKKGHKMITVVDAKATCTVAGSQHEECETCGYMDEDAVIGTIPALGHSKAEETAWTIVTEATCAEAGLLQKFCDTCHTPLTDKDGKEITRVLEATGEHEYKDYKETKAPTCTEKGAETGTCACGATDVREVKALGHEFATEFTEDEAATCTKVGSKSKHCTRTGCQEKSEVTEIPVIAHTLADDAEVTTEATCHSKGVKTGKCTVCEKTDATVEIPMKDHTWAETAVPVVGTITKENVPVLDEETGEPVLDEETGEPEVETVTYKAATCEEAGYTVKYCTAENCGAYDEASLTKVAKLEHNWAAYPQGVTATAKVDPTCTTDGKEYKYCDRDCCKREVEIKIPTTGHSWASSATVLTQSITVTDEEGNETTYNAPSCKGEGTDGYKAVFCTVAGCNGCKDFEVVKAPAHVPEFTQWTAGTAATCLKKATETNVCVNCDDPLTREVGELAAHDFSEKITRTYPTCEEDGIEYYACTVAGCKARDQEKVLPALGHVHADDAEFVGTDATCEKAGEKIKACTRLFYEDGSLYVAPSTDENDTPTTGENNTPSTGDSNANGDTGSAVAEGETETLIPCAGLKVVTPATGHAFSDDYTVDTEPTCTEEGVKSRHCTNKGCTEKTGAIKVKALGHEFGEKYTVDTKATCSAVGYESIHCTRYDDCGTKKTGSTREIPKSDHTYPATGWQPGVAATCEGEGTKTNACSVCKAPVTEKVPAKGHEWSEYYTTVPAECTKDGEVFIKCTKCDAKKEGSVTVIPATGHTLAEGFETVAPTCTKAGYDIGTCTVCNEANVKTNMKSALGHDWSGTPVVVNPTCTEDGTRTGVCTRCTGSEEGATTVETIPAPGHTYGEWEATGTDCKAENSKVRKCTVDGCDGKEYGILGEHTASGWIIGTNATCGTDGEMYTKCKICAEPLESETIKATGKHDLKETVTLEPTCNEKGSKTVTCQTKGCTYTDTVEIPANGHSFTEWKVFVEPTCTTKGIRQSVCEVCLTTQSEKILALGHDLGQYIVDAPAVCGKAGSQHKECSRCDYKTEAEPIKALKHNFVGNDCANKCGAKIYEYALVEGSTTDIIITKYNGSDENLVIPAEIDGYKVVAIGNRAFMKTVITPATEDTEEIITYVPSTFTSLTIPASITSIGDYAFGNSVLTLVNIPATVTTIGKCAFGFKVEIEMVEPDVEEGETPAEDDEIELVEEIKTTPVANFTIYGVKDSAAETYAKQDATKEDDDFAFVEVKNVYDVVIDEEETNIVEVADGVIFKEFEPVNKDDDSTKIVNQIKAVIELPEGSTYKVAVKASQSYDVMEKDEEGKDTDVVKETLNFYGTGTKILVKDATDNVVDEIVIIVEGDVNGDGAVDAIDCMLIQLAAAGNSTRPLEGVYYTAGNITADSAITADDLSAAVLKIFGEDLVVEEPTTEPTTQAPASTEPSTEGTSDESTPAESTPAESTPAESTPAATESQPASSEPAATTTTQAPATTTTTENSAA